MSLEEVHNIFQVTAFLGVTAIGQTIYLMVGGIDLSIGGMVTLTNSIPFGVALVYTGGAPHGSAARSSCPLAKDISVVFPRAD